jgi:hypothetical protein
LLEEPVAQRQESILLTHREASLGAEVEPRRDSGHLDWGDLSLDEWL